MNLTLKIVYVLSKSHIMQNKTDNREKNHFWTTACTTSQQKKTKTALSEWFSATMFRQQPPKPCDVQKGIHYDMIPTKKTEALKKALNTYKTQIPESLEKQRHTSSAHVVEKRGGSHCFAK